MTLRNEKNSLHIINEVMKRMPKQQSNYRISSNAQLACGLSYLVYVAQVVQPALLHAQGGDHVGDVRQGERRGQLHAPAVAPATEPEEDIVVHGQRGRVVVPAALEDDVRLLVILRGHVDCLDLGDLFGQALGRRVPQDMPECQLAVAGGVVVIRVYVKSLAVL